ncbi:hypothetical protein DIPPA_19192 [Diplonema papillatum]|nr:hypothetical protein DIPPA_19192 [Diplonema papillatum]
MPEKKFSALFDDSDDDAPRPVPPVVVPKPPETGLLPTKETVPAGANDDKASAPPPAMAVSPVAMGQQSLASLPAGQSGLIPDSARSHASIATSVAYSQQPQQYQPNGSASTASLHNPQPVFTGSVASAGGSPTSPPVVIGQPSQPQQQQQQQQPPQQPFAGYASPGQPAGLSEADAQKLARLSTSVDGLSQGLTAGLDATAAEIKRQLDQTVQTVLDRIGAIDIPAPAPLPLEIPAIQDFPSFKNFAAAAEAKKGYDERTQASWNEQLEGVRQDVVNLNLTEKERDNVRIQQHSTEQIEQLRTEKNELRKLYEVSQSELAKSQEELQKRVARENTEMQQFKTSFNEMMKAQSEEMEQLRKAFQDEQERAEQLHSELSTKTQLANKRQSQIQEMELELSALKVEKSSLESRLAMTSSQYDIAQTQLVDLRDQLAKMDHEKEEMTEFLDATVKAKYDYADGLRKRHDDHLTVVCARFEERERFLTNEYVTKEAALRTDLLQFADQCKRTAEEMLGRFRTECTRETQRLTDLFHSQAKEMKQKHKTDLADLSAQKDQMRKEYRAKLKEVEDRHVKRDEEQRRAHDKDTEEARKRLDRAVESADKRFNDATSDLRKEMAAKGTAAKQEMTKAVQQAQLEGKQRLAELEAQHRIKVSHLEKQRADDKEQLMAMFSRELSKIGEEHRKAERELEKLHRDREAELDKRVKLFASSSESTQQDTKQAVETSKMKDDFMGKWESQRQQLRDRHATVKKSLDG